MGRPPPGRQAIIEQACIFLLGVGWLRRLCGFEHQELVIERVVDGYTVIVSLINNQGDRSDLNPIRVRIMNM